LVRFRVSILLVNSSRVMGFTQAGPLDPPLLKQNTLAAAASASGQPTAGESGLSRFPTASRSDALCIAT
jgi:hypothetical protein